MEEYLKSLEGISETSSIKKGALENIIQEHPDSIILKFANTEVVQTSTEITFTIR